MCVCVCVCVCWCGSTCKFFASVFAIGFHQNKREHGLIVHSKNVQWHIVCIINPLHSYTVHNLSHTKKLPQTKSHQAANEHT